MTFNLKLVVFVLAVSVGFHLPVYTALSDEAPSSTSRTLPLEGARNFRDLGGYQTNTGQTVRWEKIYRSDNLANLTVADIATLRERGIRTIIDFRSKTERAMAETAWTGVQAPDYLLLPIGDTASDWSASLTRFLRTGNFGDGDFHRTFIEMYRATPTDATDQYRALFETILKDEGAVLFHCTAGKDRTGMAAALILTVLGVPQQTIVNDYMLTNEAVNADHSAAGMADAFGKRYGRAIDPTEMFPLVGVKNVYLQTMFDSIETDYGSMDNYLEHGLMLSSEDRAALKQLLLVDSTY